MPAKKILLGHGSGGRLMHELIKELPLRKFNNPILKELSDSATINYKEKLAFTTDSFVVSPLFFPGADIGKLAVCGTVNDLLMAGARPEYISLALIIEEGLELRILERVMDSIAREAKKCAVWVVTGDLKVVEKGACDKLFINTSGIGRLLGATLSVRNIEVGDKVIVTGEIGQHGLAVLSSRKGSDLGFKIKSDCCALDKLLIPLLKKTKAVKFMRDPTRGGLATTLNEIAEGCKFGIMIEEKKVPVSAKVRVACELLGLDPLYLANEGAAVIVVRSDCVKEVVSLLKRHPLGRKAGVIGSLTKVPEAKVILETPFGSRRIVGMLEGEAFPRIC
jgi:hydrogenase expression/formation protein HypE